MHRILFVALLMLAAPVRADDPGRCPGSVIASVNKAFPKVTISACKPERDHGKDIFEVKLTRPGGDRLEVGDRVARGQDQHAGAVAGGTQSAQDREAIDPWQHEVKDDGVVGMVLGVPQPVDARAGGVDRVASITQPPRQRLAQRDVVLDDEQAHAASVPVPAALDPGETDPRSCWRRPDRRARRSGRLAAGKGDGMRILSSAPDVAQAPGVVVMMHGPGLDRFLEDRVAELARHGYAAAAPDPYHREVASSLAVHLRDRAQCAEILMVTSVRRR